MIRFRYHPTLNDYLRLNRMLLWRRLRWLMIFAVGGLLLFLFYPCFVQQRASDESLFDLYSSIWPLLILPGLMTMIIVTTERASRQRWANAPEVRADRDYEIDESGLRVTSESFSGSLDWSHFTHSEERSGLFYLSTAQNLFYFFPVAIVPDLPALKALTAQKITVAKKSKLWLRILLVWFGIIAVAVVIALLPRS